MTHDEMIEAAACALLESMHDGEMWDYADVWQRDRFRGFAEGALVVAGVIPSERGLPDRQVRRAPDGVAWQKDGSEWYSTSGNPPRVDDELLGWPVLRSVACDCGGLA